MRKTTQIAARVRDTSGGFTVPVLTWWQKLAAKLLGKVEKASR